MLSTINLICKLNCSLPKVARLVSLVASEVYFGASICPRCDIYGQINLELRKCNILPPRA